MAPRARHLEPAIRAFTPADLRAWCEGLGIETFIGSSGRVFPKQMKASPLLRAWLARLASLGVQLVSRSHWTGWEGDALTFDTPDGKRAEQADAAHLRARRRELAASWLGWRLAGGIRSARRCDRAAASGQLGIPRQLVAVVPREVRRRAAQARGVPLRRPHRARRSRSGKLWHRGRRDLCAGITHSRGHRTHRRSQSRHRPVARSRHRRAGRPPHHHAEGLNRQPPAQGRALSRRCKPPP